MRNFLDPVSRLPPFRENHLTTLLAIYHQLDRIDWKSILLLTLADLVDSGRWASEIFGNPGTVCSEYTLFWEKESREKEKIFGDMRPDLLYISRDLQLVAVLENKVGARLKRGQLETDIAYISSGPIPQKYVILLTSEMFLKKQWYASEFRQVMASIRSEGKVQGFFLTWESILAAFSVI